MSQMAEMTCVFCPGDHQVEVATTAIEQPGPGEMRVRTMASAICGSDLHHYRTSQRVRSERGWSQYAIGHESSGIVDAVGPGVHYPSEGDRVVVFGLLGSNFGIWGPLHEVPPDGHLAMVSSSFLLFRVGVPGPGKPRKN